jgi:hypothetical protein
MPSSSQLRLGIDAIARPLFSEPGTTDPGGGGDDITIDEDFAPAPTPGATIPTIFSVKVTWHKPKPMVTTTTTTATPPGSGFTTCIATGLGNLAGQAAGLYLALQSSSAILNENPEIVSLGIGYAAGDVTAIEFMLACISALGMAQVLALLGLTAGAAAVIVTLIYCSPG